MGIFSPGTRRTKATAVTCKTCGEEMNESWGKWDRVVPEPRHCEGSLIAFDAKTIPTPHHARYKYKKCWSCGGEMGCSKCAGPIDQVLCIRCVVWTTTVAFAEHGPILNTEVMVAKRNGKRAPQFEEYPERFKAKYRQARQHDPEIQNPAIRPELNRIIRENLG